MCREDFKINGKKVYLHHTYNVSENGRENKYGFLYLISFAGEKFSSEYNKKFTDIDPDLEVVQLLKVKLFTARPKQVMYLVRDKEF